MKIVTSHQYPPIPMREFDWAAHFEGEEDGLVGYGPTEKKALSDLLSQVADSSVPMNQPFWDAYRAAMDKAEEGERVEAVPVWREPFPVLAVRNELEVQRLREVGAL